MKVLVPIDGEELLDVTVPAVRRLLQAAPGAELLFLRVLDPRAVHGLAQQDAEMGRLAIAGSSGPAILPPPPRIVESHGEAMARIHAEAEAALWDLALGEFPDAIPSVAVVWSRHPAARIVEAADEHDVDVIVMATHGRGGLAHVIAGSVTEEVIRRSGRPVLVVGPAFGEKEALAAC
ncbi:MAG: universal stress protein [Hyphomicrobiales bacterium]